MNTQHTEGGESEISLTHRDALRRSLLSVHSKGVFSAHLSPRSLIINLFSMKKTLVPAGILVLALAMFVSMGFGDSNVAQARELLDRSFTKAFKLSPEMQARLESHMKAGLQATYEEAKAAPDLRVLSAEEYEKEALFTISKTPGVLPPEANLPEGATGVFFAHSNGEMSPVGDGKEVKNVIFEAEVSAIHPEEMTEGVRVETTPFEAPVKYLSYTDPEGRKVVLGIDKNDTPVMKISTLEVGDIIPGPDGTIGFPAEGKAWITEEKIIVR
jgi:hypothetical protein